MTAVNIVKEAFQSAAATAEPKADTNLEPGQETAVERDAYDMFEYENSKGLATPPPTLMQKYDGAAALAEFDDDAPVPWDIDNRDADPAELLWGNVDARCSQELRDRARMRAIFYTANNVEVAPDASMGYFAAKLNGMIFHDPQQIIAVQYLEFMIDTEAENFIESALDDLQEGIIGKESKMLGEASEQARAQLKADPEFRTMTKAQRKAKYAQLQAKALDNLKKLEGAKGLTKSTRMAKLAKVFKAQSIPYTLFKKGIRALLRPAAQVFKKLTRSALGKLGTKVGTKVLAKFAAIRAARLAAQQALRRSILAPFYSIPIYGQILAAVMELLNLMFLIVIPQILADYADLEQDPTGNDCNNNFQGCPSSHPFNLRCAVIKACGDAFWEFFVAIPLLGDSIAAFSPYLCTAQNLTAVFRQSFRPPPYYFDSTLSIFFAEKPSILSGNPDGSNADPMYREPGLFKLKPEGGGNTSSTWNVHYHPWVDFSHTEMLDKMAEFYYEKAIKFATVDINGWATFQYIDQFKGLIASSQYSCDVQVTLKEVKYRPFTGQIADGWPKSVPNPYQTMEVADTGCSFHDRRFYFTWDFTKSGAGGLNLAATAPVITETVLSWADRLSIPDRLAAFRRMCIVTGCTHENGTAADVVDNTPDGEPISDAPVALGVQNTAYLPPLVYVPPGVANSIAEIPNSDDQCRTYNTKMNHYGIRSARPSTAGGPLAGKPPFTDPGRVIYQADESLFTPGLDENTPTTRVFATAASIATLPTSPAPPLSARTYMTVNTVSQLATVYPSPRKGDIVHVLSTRLDHIYWDQPTVGWVPYKPKPVWRTNSQIPGNNLTWLQGTTKYWQERPVERSTTERWGTGIQGGLVGALPLYFGFNGGLVATTMDAFGISGVISCLYTDTMKQPGNYVLNGYTVTSQPKFVLNRGSIILYAPGYTPRLTNPCGNFRISQEICSNRLALRRLVKRFETTYAAQSRRLKYLISSRPDYDTSQCFYSVTSVEKASDGTDVAGSERTERVSVPYRVPSGSSTCTLLPGGLLLGYPTSMQFSPYDLDGTQINPPLKESELATLTASNPTFRRSTDAACSAYVDCAAPAIRDRLIKQFNDDHIMGTKADNSPAYSIQMQTPTVTLTPLITSTETATGISEYKPGMNQPVCVYKGNFTVDNSTEAGARTNTITKTITMALKPTTGTDNDTLNKCAYDIESHDFPYKFFPAPVPGGNPFEFPNMTATTATTLPALATCTDAAVAEQLGLTVAALTQNQKDAARAAYRDCSGFDVIDRLVSQFNLKYTDRKILRVIKAFTPAVTATASGAAPVCDYEVDIQRLTRENPPRSYVERDTLRMTLAAPGAGCLYDLAGDGSEKRQSGATITSLTDTQGLTNEYIWPMNVITGVRKRLNTLIGRFIPLDVPGKVDDAARTMKNKLTTLSQAINVTTIQGCATGAPGSRCGDASTLIAFMNRYNYDNSPPYPSGQFGSTVRTIIGWRRAGLGGPRECQVELVEREETFPNWVIKRLDVSGNTSPETARFYMRKYAFAIENVTAAGTAPATGSAGTTCVIVPRRFTSTEIQGRTFELKGEPYAIQADASVVKLPTTFSYTGSQIDPRSLAVINAMKRAADAYRPNAQGRVGQTVKEITKVLQARPNVIEYGVKIDERINDPDFGFSTSTGIDAIVVVTWKEDQWNPVTGAFVGGTVPPPDVLVFVPGRARFVNKQVVFDGVVYANPPYMFWPVPTFDPKAQESRIQDFLLTLKADGSWTVKASPNAAEQPYTRA